LIPKLPAEKWILILRELDQAPYDHVNVSSNIKDLMSADIGEALDLQLLS
jgi:hypothetical protein